MSARDLAAIGSACALTAAAVAFTTFRLCCWAGELLDSPDVPDENGHHR